MSSVGEWRSLAARYVRDVEAPGSNPGSPTIHCPRVETGFWRITPRRGSVYSLAVEPPHRPHGMEATS